MKVKKVVSQKDFEKIERRVIKNFVAFLETKGVTLEPGAADEKVDREVNKQVVKDFFKVAKEHADDKEALKITKKTLKTKVEDLRISSRTYNRMKKAGIGTVGDALALTNKELKSCIGRKSIEDFDKVLRKDFKFFRSTDDSQVIFTPTSGEAFV